jgi:integrase
VSVSATRKLGPKRGSGPKHIRTVPVPAWAKRVVDEWTHAASISTGALFRRVGRIGKVWGASLTPKAIWYIVKAAAKRADIKNLAPHDLRRTCAPLCHLAGGELEQIQFLLGHISSDNRALPGVQTETATRGE